MQSQFNENLQGKHDLYAELKNMKGIEFVIAVAKEPEMWIIRKQNRFSPQEVRQLATYFVVGENIYMAPTIYHIISARLLSTTLALSKALSIASSLPTYIPSQGYSYKSGNAASPSAEEQANTPSSSASNAPLQRAKAMSGAAASSTATPTPGPNTSIQPSGGQYGPVLDEANRPDRSMERALAASISKGASYLDDSKSEPKRRISQRN
jgi:mediator of RNA polymerase II transcription subunit 6